MFLSAMKRGGMTSPQLLNTALHRCFASLSASDLSAIKREDVISATDSKWIASYTQAVVASGDQSGAHSDALNEYFRKNFRKLSREQALDVVNSLAVDIKEPAACLDSRFWVWEALEEALRADVDELSAEDLVNTYRVFAANFKGSTDFLEVIESRFYRSGDPFAKE